MWQLHLSVGSVLSAHENVFQILNPQTVVQYLSDFLFFFNAVLLEPFYHVNEEKKTNPPKTSENA